MAQQVRHWLVDDLDGNEADETVTFALDGKFYEIDLTTSNAHKLRELLEPYCRKGRRAGTGNLNTKGAPHKTGHRATVLQLDDSAEVRTWARRYNLPVNDRGRVNGKLRDAYRAFRKDDRTVLRHLLEESNLDPAAADTDGKTISAEPEAPKPMPVEERNELAAKKAGRLSSAQLTRLRKAHADKNGMYVSDGKSGDATSCEALTNRGLFVLAEDGVYQITPAGRAWFNVNDVSPDL